MSKTTAETRAHLRAMAEKTAEEGNHYFGLVYLAPVHLLALLDDLDAAEKRVETLLIYVSQEPCRQCWWGWLDRTVGS